MTFIVKSRTLALTIAILLLSEGELSAQQPGTISIDRVFNASPNASSM
jgi:hypothetical protein